MKLAEFFLDIQEEINNKWPGMSILTVIAVTALFSSIAEISAIAATL